MSLVTSNINNISNRGGQYEPVSAPVFSFLYRELTTILPAIVNTT